MGKKCVICEGEADFVVKGTSDYYCKQHAEEFFGDISVLQSIDAQARELKDMLKNRMAELEEGLTELDSATGQQVSKD